MMQPGDLVRYQDDVLTGAGDAGLGLVITRRNRFIVSVIWSGPDPEQRVTEEHVSHLKFLNRVT